MRNSCETSAILLAKCPQTVIQRRDMKYIIHCTHFPYNPSSHGKFTPSPLASREAQTLLNLHVAYTFTYLMLAYPAFGSSPACWPWYASVSSSACRASKEDARRLKPSINDGRLSETVDQAVSVSGFDAYGSYTCSFFRVDGSGGRCSGRWRRGGVCDGFNVGSF
jgi:hypothetical protein